MERARTTGSDREAALRRVAIVLSSLPPEVASRLMGPMDPDSRRQLRRAMTSLTDVDPLERKRALQAFRGSLSPSPARRDATPSTPQATEVHDEISLRQEESPTPAAGSRVVSGLDEPQDANQPNRQALSFLGDVDDDTLAGMLRGEHPQTIALVLASIAPDQAARILPSLDATVQGDALNRIGRLGEIPQEVVGEIAVHLRARIEQCETVRQSESGKRALGAILAALPAQASNPTPGFPIDSRDAAQPSGISPDSVNQPSRPAMSTLEPISPIAEPARAPTPSNIDDASPQSGSRPASDRHQDDPRFHLSAVDQTHRLRLVTGAAFDEETIAHDAPEPIEPAREPSPGHAEPSSPSDSADLFGSTDAIHQHLIRLSASELCQSLGKVNTREAMLALCGLPNEVAEAVLGVLPRSHAKQVRRGMSSLQSIQLREIDKAKEAVARASIDDGQAAPGQLPAETHQQPTPMAA